MRRPASSNHVPNHNTAAAPPDAPAVDPPASHRPPPWSDARAADGGTHTPSRLQAAGATQSKAEAQLLLHVVPAHSNGEQSTVVPSEFLIVWSPSQLGGRGTHVDVGTSHSKLDEQSAFDWQVWRHVVGLSQA